MLSNTTPELGPVAPAGAASALTATSAPSARLTFVSRGKDFPIRAPCLNECGAAAVNPRARAARYNGFRCMPTATGIRGRLTSLGDAPGGSLGDDHRRGGARK